MEIETLEKNYLVYLLQNDGNPCTYVGSTNNAKRRIRQHNGNLCGGARYTSKHKPENHDWFFYGYIPNLTKHQALSIEKKIQIRSRRMKDKKAIDRRIQAIFEILEKVNDPNIVFCLGNP